MQVSINRWAGIAVYLLAITGISLLGTKLSSVVAQQAIVLALPHLDNGPPSCRSSKKGASTRREPASRRLGSEKTCDRVRDTLNAPNLLAAHLDLAEKEDLPPALVALAADGSLEPASQPSSTAVRVYSY